MKYNLMSRDNLIVPNMEDGADATASTTSETPAAKPTPPVVANTTESEA